MSSIEERHLEAIERERQVLLLRKAKVSYREIAERVPGIGTAASAHRAFRRALARDVPVELIAELRQAELEDLDMQEQRALAVQASRHYLLHEGKPVEGPDGTPLDDDAIKIRAGEWILKIKERRARYVGLDAPTKARVEVVSVEAVEAAIARLRAEGAAWDAMSADDEPLAELGPGA